MEQGETEAKIVAQAKKMKMPLPEAIANKPTVSEGLGFYWEAFSELTSDRGIGMGEGPIRWTAIDAYGYRYGVWGDDFDRLVTIIRCLDSVYLQQRIKKNEKSLKSKQRKEPITRRK